jgi:hypothetical protein
VHRDQPRDVAQPGDERDQQQEKRGRAGQVDGDEADVVGVTPARDVVPQLVQPEPRLQIATITAISTRFATEIVKIDQFR